MSEIVPLNDTSNGEEVCRGNTAPFFSVLQMNPQKKKKNLTNVMVYWLYPEIRTRAAPGWTFREAPFSESFHHESIHLPVNAVMDIYRWKDEQIASAIRPKRHQMNQEAMRRWRERWRRRPRSGNLQDFRLAAALKFHRSEKHTRPNEKGASRSSSEKERKEGSER